VVNSEELSAWWLNLNDKWKDALSSYIHGDITEAAPQKEQLTKLLLQDSLDLQSHGLEDISPIQKFSRLRYLSISNNPIKSLVPIEGLNALSTLEAENTQVNSIKSILRLKKLQRLNLAKNQLSEEQFLSLSKLNSLKLLDVDQSGIGAVSVEKFLSQEGSDISVIYDREGIKSWWDDLNTTWKSILKLQSPLSLKPTDKELHDLTAIKSIIIIKENIQNLSPLSQFIHLEKVHLEGVGYIDLESVTAIRKVKHLSITNSPISDLEPLSQLYYLERLILDFTAVSDLKPLEKMQSLEYLSLAGTQVRNLKGIENLIGLKYLDISSTQIRWIGKLSLLDNLEQFICYNTRIFNFSLTKFKEQHPECKLRFY
jgi:Leucine-rich repeat (LRR) protein